MNEVGNQDGANGRPLTYWRLWVFDALLVSGGALFFLATQYGTFEFFGKACAMAMLPCIPVLVLVGGAGSTIFVLTKATIDRRSIKMPAAVALLAGPALAVTLLLGLLAAVEGPGHHLNYICLGNVPPSASSIRIAGFSTFLHEEWLAVFNVGQKDFQTMVAKAGLAPADDLEFRKALGESSVTGTRLGQTLPPLRNAWCFQRVFKKEDHQLGSVYMLFDATNLTAVVFRKYQD